MIFKNCKSSNSVNDNSIRLKHNRRLDNIIWLSPKQKKGKRRTGRLDECNRSEWLFMYIIDEFFSYNKFFSYIII